MRRHLATLLAVAALTPAAIAWTNLDGQTAPDLEVKEWLNVGRKAPDAKDLKGKILYIEIFGVG